MILGGKMNIEKILETKYGQYQWSIINDDYSTLKWSADNEIDKPSLEELEGIHGEETFHAEVSNNEAIANRQHQIIQQWPIEKQFEALTENAMGRPEKLNELINFISQTKEEHPKS